MENMNDSTPSRYILFYGNCQTGAVMETMRGPKSSFPIHENTQMTHIFCVDTPYTEEEFRRIIEQSDVIVTQPIHDNYRDVHYLSTKYIVEKARPETIIILFPSLWFNFYYPDYNYYNYFVLSEGKHLEIPTSYQYHTLLNYYLEKKKTLDEFMTDCVDNPHFFSPDELEDKARTSIQELRRREEELVINSTNRLRFIHVIQTCSDFIEEHYKKTLLFYSINHPTNILIQHVAKQIADILQWGDIDENVDVLYRSERGILYKSLQNVVDFDISQHKPLHRHCIDRTTFTFIHLETKESILETYWKSYEDNHVEDLIHTSP